jgi:hypothetical protein
LARKNDRVAETSSQRTECCSFLKDEGDQEGEDDAIEGERFSTSPIPGNIKILVCSKASGWQWMLAMVCPIR